MKSRSFVSAILAGMMCLMLVLISIIPAQAMDAKTLERLERIIQQQQAQIEAQQKAIKELRQEVEGMKRESAERPASTAAAGGDEKGVPVKVATGTAKAEVQLYGQVNRGVLYSNDGDKGRWYQVDNDNSSTRIGLKGKAAPTDNFEIGTRIELQFESNSTADVNQEETRGASSNHFTKRWLDLYLKSNRFGKLYVGFGSTASDGSSEVDFSGTSVVGYSGVGDMAGGQIFYDSLTQDLSETTIGDAFSNMDGLGRDERIRYDSPVFYGFMLGGSYIADGGGDVALNYSGAFGDFKLAGALAYANPGGAFDSYDDQFSGSVSTLHSSGLNLTLAGGMRQFKEDNRDDADFFYAKLGYQLNICPLGMTAISLDYGKYNDVNQRDDEADTFGAMMVQNFEEWATEYYLGYRLYKLDRAGADFEDTSSVLTGFRVKF